MSDPYIQQVKDMKVAGLAQEYKLPGAVKLALEAAVSQSTAIALVLALFASALVSLAQMIASVSPTVDTSAGNWVALRFFTFSAIILNLVGAFLSLITIKMCSDLPVAAQQTVTKKLGLNERATQERDIQYWITAEHWNIPYGVATGFGVLPPHILENHFLLLRCFGMSKWYEFVDRSSSVVLVLACVCTVAALTFWMFLNEPQMTAGVTMIMFGSAAIISICSLLISFIGQGWRSGWQSQSLDLTAVDFEPLQVRLRYLGRVATSHE